MNTAPIEPTNAEMAAAAARDAELAPIDWSVLPEGSERDTFNAPSGPLARVRVGPNSGPRVLLVPGMSGSKEDFARMMPLLADAGYRVESFDMAGQYESAVAGPPHGERYTMELFCADFEAVLRAGRTPAHVLGYSFAGTVAAVVAAAHPELFASLTLMSVTPASGQSLRAFKVLGPFSDVISPKLLSRVFTLVLRHNLNRVPPDRAAFVKERLVQTRIGSVRDVFELMKDSPDVAAFVRAAGVPTVSIVGTHDIWQLTAHREFAAELGARLVVLDAGHSPCETAPHQVVTAMGHVVPPA